MFDFVKSVNEIIRSSILPHPPTYEVKSESPGGTPHLRLFQSRESGPLVTITRMFEIKRRCMNLKLFEYYKSLRSLLHTQL